MEAIPSRNAQKTSCGPGDARGQRHRCARAIWACRTRPRRAPRDSTNPCAPVLSSGSCAENRYTAFPRKHALWRPPLLLPASGPGKCCKCASPHGSSPPPRVPVHWSFGLRRSGWISHRIRHRLRCRFPALRCTDHCYSNLIPASTNADPNPCRSQTRFNRVPPSAPHLDKPNS